jgi:hypothetical protein
MNGEGSERDGAPRNTGRSGWIPPLDALSRRLVLALLALFTLLVIVLAQSALWADGVSLSMKAVLVGAAVLTLIRPRDGLLLLVGLTPLSRLGAERLLHSWLQGSESLTLACLSGALVHGWWSGRLRRFRANRMEAAALVFGFIVAAACAEQLWLLQRQRDFPWPFAQHVWHHVSRDYLVTYGGLATIFYAMLLLEGIALLVWTMASCRLEPQLTTRILRMVVGGAVGAAALNIFSAVTAIGTAPAAARVWTRLVTERWTFHIDDYNAAASFFALAIFIAAGLAPGRGQARSAWWAAAAVVGVALWMTGSRTAVVCVAMTLVGVVLAWRPADRAWSTGVIAGACVLALGSVSLFREAAGTAVNIRWMFLTTTLRMLAWQPIFGVGVGQYNLWAKYFGPRALIAQQLENAHNNFAQLAGELGVVGLISLLALLLCAWWQWRQANRTGPLERGVLAGVAVFVLSWLGGHPLLVPEVAYPFWVSLGVLSSLPPAENSPRQYPRQPASTAAVRSNGGRFATLAVAAAILLAVSLPLRLLDKSRTIDWKRTSYGFYDWEVGPSGEHFRWTGARARLFVEPGVTRVALPVRAYADAGHPFRIDLFVGGRLADQVRLTDPAWRTIDFMTPGRHPRDFTEVDLRLDRTWAPSDGHPGSPDSRQLGIQVGELIVRAREAQPAERTR